MERMDLLLPADICGELRRRAKAEGLCPRELVQSALHDWLLERALVELAVWPDLRQQQRDTAAHWKVSPTGL